MKPVALPPLEFRTAAGEAMAISIPRSEAAVIRHFQEGMLYGLFVPEVPFKGQLVGHSSHLGSATMRVNEYMPMRASIVEPGPKISYGPLLDIFMLDSPPKTATSVPDLAKLSDRELALLDRLMMRAHGVAPPPKSKRPKRLCGVEC
jgi:hypothetical protein